MARLTNILNVRLTTTDRRRLELAAQQAGYACLSDFLRRAVLREVDVVLRRAGQAARMDARTEPLDGAP